MVNPVCYWFHVKKNMHTSTTLIIRHSRLLSACAKPSERSQPGEIRMHGHIPVNYPRASRHATGKNSRTALLDSEHKHAHQLKTIIFALCAFGVRVHGGTELNLGAPRCSARVSQHRFQSERERDICSRVDINSVVYALAAGPIRDFWWIRGAWCAAHHNISAMRRCIPNTRIEMQRLHRHYTIPAHLALFLFSTSRPRM
jgi:hypothetical protein